MLTLVLNAGSTSMKFKLYGMGNGEQVLAQGNCQRLGLKNSTVKFVGPYGETRMITTDLGDHLEAMDLTLRLLSEGEGAPLGNVKDLGAIGHRIAMGGPDATKSKLIDEDVISAIEQYAYITPLHSPPQVAAIRACQKLLGGSFPQVAGFDTAFHQTIPKEVYFCPIPYEYYEKYGVRRLGFHGLSHQYIAGRYFQLTHKDTKGSRVVTCHLGGGSSLSAIRDGKSIDNTLGFGTGQGLMCGTRAGTFDHTAIAHLMRVTGKSFDEIEDDLQTRSGFLGVSGVSSDVGDVEQSAHAGNERSQLALDMFTCQIKKYIGAYTFLMGGLDAVLFAGGIGENSEYVRRRVCQGLESIGILLDERLNSEYNHKEGRISQVGSPVDLWVIPTNEELVIARDTFGVVQRLGM
ncbi:MAG: acetate/propionate family kinase [Oscillospiraceae bacterium]|nr:acetate/propionate family kinase [Oscillospiraceae bacterium]